MIKTVAGAEMRVPSLTAKVKLSSPVKPGFGQPEVVLHHFCLGDGVVQRIERFLARATAKS